ncbi:cobalt ABC transporter [Terrihabitans soli]|uniref:Cobalt ABC transporter n=1 Tax=Terrihabitans soli TaxID=708113 RepID=A0A6S6QW54_9HYPH|nr:energy-coupling factor transporter transmembrane component T [Terrihabitans soli]BCJ91482.1 cobalt ABC transporter [Terrihabitans soli]
MISGYLARQTWLHPVPAGAKLIALAVLSFAILPVDDWRLLAAFLLLTLAVFASLGREALKRVTGLRPLFWILAIIFVLHALTGDWQAGASAVLRLVTMILLADLVSMTTTLQDMMQALMPLLRLLRPFGVNPKKLSLAVSLAIRFVPVFSAQWHARAEAWKARTGKKPGLRLIGPFIADTFRMADHVAEALDARGFARKTPRG